jgi:hypothetical protein
MAFPATGPGGQPIPEPDPNQDFEAYVQSLVDKQISAAQTPPGGEGTDPRAPAAQPITVTLPDGSKQTYTSEEELSKSLQHMVGAYNSKIAELSQTAQPAPQPQAGAKPQLDSEKFVALMNEDPAKAFDYVDSFRYFDGEVEKPSEAMRDMMTRLAATERVLAAAQFKDAHPEFLVSPNGPQVIQTIMEQGGMDFTFQNLEMALAKAQQAGVLPTRQQYNQYVQNQIGQPQQAPPQPEYPGIPADGNPPVGYPPQQMPQPPVPQMQVPQSTIPGNPPHMNVFNPQMPQPAPPKIGGPAATQPSPNWQAQAENLTTEQIEEIFRQTGNQ